MADPKKLANALSSYQPNPNDPSMQVVNGRMVFYDQSGNVAAYENELGTLVPGPAATAPRWSNMQDPEYMASNRTHAAPTNSRLNPDDLPRYTK